MAEDLDALLCFLVKVSKQTHWAHVILATAEYSFISWLTWKLDDPFFETQVVGDFREPEARLYLEHTLGASVTDAEWAEIFGRCVEAMQAVCEGPQGTPQTSRTGHKVDFVC
eukprot:jgi/Astpho2/8540/Aster-05574